MKFRDIISEQYPHIQYIPSGFKRYSHVMILRSDKQLSSQLGEAILEVYSWCKSVYQHQTTQGESRIPQLRLLAGVDNANVCHKENGVYYSIDLKRITFSGGNRFLRERLVKEIKPGEFLLDMFAAVGNLSLQPMFHLDIEGLLVERNPYTFSHLQKSLKLNKLSHDLSLNTDCRSLKLNNVADRIFMGYHEVDESHLKVACNAAKSGSFIHIHPLINSDNEKEEINYISNIFEKLNYITELDKIHYIKDYAPGIQHVELIYQIEK